MWFCSVVVFSVAIARNFHTLKSKRVISKKHTAQQIVRGLIEKKANKRKEAKEKNKIGGTYRWYI